MFSNLPQLFLLSVAVASSAQAGPGLPPPPAHVQVTSEYGFEFSTIASTGNAAYAGPTLNGYPGGRGAVSYEYRIARSEVSTAQWLEFANVAAKQDLNLFFQVWPSFWGAARDGSYSGPGRRYSLISPSAAESPVTGISWRAAAMYCNWLNNGKQQDVASFTYGAYDTATFGITSTGFSDQPAHSPGARFWIPSVDEWIKAVHFDPNRSGPGQGGYWSFPNGTDTPLVSGPPGVGLTNAGTGWSYSFLLNSYPDVQSPWGLLDASGMAAEWLEDYASPLQQARVIDGSGWGSIGYGPTGAPLYFFDDIRLQNLLSPPDSQNGDTGLRIASAIPGPSSFMMIACALRLLQTRKRK
jgi:hypothetical protein